MVTAASAESLPGAISASQKRTGLVRIAWRNLWRSPRRTILTGIGIAGSIFLVTALVSMQLGAYDQMIDIGTRLMSGHAQVQHPLYRDEQKLEHAVGGAVEIADELRAIPGVDDVAPRTEAFALISVGERSFGGLVMGVDPRAERTFAELPQRVTVGEYLPTGQSAYVGEALARNLGIEVGDEIIALGATTEGGVAAGVYLVHGLFSTGNAELDRGVIQVPIETMQADFELGDRVHRIVIALDRVGDLDDLRPALESVLKPEAHRFVPWTEVVPEIQQSIEMDWVGAQAMYGLLMAVVLLFVVNSIVIIIFERTQEFGMLLAIGMRPLGIVRMLLLEAVFVWALGAAIGVLLAMAIILPLSVVGLSISAIEGTAEMLFLPRTIWPKFDLTTMILPATVMFFGTIVAATLPALRVRRLKPVEALRDQG